MSEPSRPAVVKKLDETVVNRIAAGEVIQRPANALKELLENSLDAKSTTIQVTVKSGGLKLLQIQDNGSGIRKEDLEIVCERFTTSKLTLFEDLNSIDTFGFRGEALASISHVAHLTIITKTADDACAHRSTYKDGRLDGPIKPCAGNQGTQIIVEDLFYNVATRRKSLKSPNEEHSKVVDVVSKYAIHYPKVGFTLRKHGESNHDVRTNPNSSYVDNISSIYGSAIAKSVEPVETEDENLRFTLKGYISNANFSMKKPIFLLFINNRLVDSQALRKTLDQVYSLYLPKASHPFLYLSLTIDPKNVDVNVHPTKHEVHFLHEDAIIDKIKKAIEGKLTNCNKSRIFYTQTKLPGEPKVTTAKPSKSSVDDTNIAANHLVRTDKDSQKLDKFFSVNATSSGLDKNASSFEIKREIKLTSVLNLRKAVLDNIHYSLKDILQNFTYVGAANRTWSIIQYKTELYVCNNELVLAEMFYQLMLLNFGNFGTIKFTNSLPLTELISIALEDIEASDGETKKGIEEAAATVISAKRLMLGDYFSLDIDEKGDLCSVPCLLDDYIPLPEGLPSYVLSLATDVSWEDETECFRSFCKETAAFYVYEWMKDSNVPEDLDEKTEPPQTKWHWTLEHILYPAIKKHLLPSKQLFDNRAVLEIASLPNLYKVFERC